MEQSHFASSEQTKRWTPLLKTTTSMYKAIDGVNTQAYCLTLSGQSNNENNKLDNERDHKRRGRYTRWHDCQ